MYSPKIREDLIPYLYQLAKARRVPMTTLVDNLLRPTVMQLAEDIGPTTGEEDTGCPSMSAYTSSPNTTARTGN